jgi:hypothetical protein
MVDQSLLYGLDMQPQHDPMNREHRRDSDGRNAPMSAPNMLPVIETNVALPLEWQVHPGVPSQPAVPRTLSLVPDSEPVGEPTLQIPLPLASVAQLARAIAEVGYGVRPANQLHRWVVPEQLKVLQARGSAIRRHPSSQGMKDARSWHQVRAIRIMPVTPVAAETSAVLIGSRRACAVAMRMELVTKHWIVTAARLA